MPLYNFFCKKCDLVVEFYLSSWNDKNSICPECGKKLVRFIGKTNVRVSSNITTPTSIGDNHGTCVKVPIISDRKTGKTLGTGSPQIPISN